MKSKLIIGIDPGKSGGIGYLHINSNGIIAAAAKKMPDTERDLYDALNSLFMFAINNGLEPVCYLEKVWAMSGEGVKSVWSFSGNYHGIRMALIANMIPFHDVTAMKWQKKLSVAKSNPSVPKTAHKNNLKAASQQLYPHIKMTHAIADALLICEYGRITELGL